MYIIAETLFILSCAAQACSALVETAQSLDGFIASFLLGQTYGVELYPRMQVVTWSATNCHVAELPGEKESDVDECTPFHDAGSLIFTLGFAVTTLLFLPLGRRNLKETILLQMVSFFCMGILLTQFSGEFLARGLDISRVPMWGKDVTQVLM